MMISADQGTWRSRGLGWTRAQLSRNTRQVYGSYVVTPQLLAGAKEEMVLMHPLPRINEIRSVHRSSHSSILSSVTPLGVGGVLAQRLSGPATHAMSLDIFH